MAMSTPTITNISTDAFRGIHPSGDQDPRHGFNEGAKGNETLLRPHHVSHVSYLNDQSTGRAILTYCAEHNALNIDLIS